MSISSPSSENELKDYVIASLGSDVVKVELSSDQMSIVIDNAMQVFFDRVYDGCEIVYINIKLPQSGTASTCKVTMPSDIVSVNSIYGITRPSEFKLFTYVYEPSNLLFNREYTFSFSRYAHTITVNETIDIETSAIANVHRKIDISTYTDLYNHPWLKKYAVALATQQWGNNLSKYTNVPLPGNIQLNGESILNRGNELVRLAEEELNEKWAFYPLPIVK